ncbi:Peptidase M75, Imelysin [Devosia sp. LC5]|uniref:imelysin family protein n=1 Tax=Devosia sp. LC5 TaxID=1502724 RepID=UPI0004E2C30F|nr:imelysin family protein [Devosia sp. LC5]KFC62560.1 Peptidase M75, Imelysin [Devosia sp. LC5]
MRLMLVLLLFLGAAPVMAQKLTTTAALANAVNEVIRPGFADLRAEAHGLVDAMADLCAMPSADAQQLAREWFGKTATAYGRVEFVRIGPLMEDNRSDRLLFWPDRKGIALRQVQAILADEDASATALDTLRGKSVAVQGLNALEFVLFGTGAEALAGAEGAFRCQYGATVAQSISGIADALSEGWNAEDGIAAHLMAPNEAYADYRTETEALEALVSLISHGAEGLRDTRINPFIAQGEKAAVPKQALFWRSGLTMAIAEANIEGLEKLFAVSGVALIGGAADSGLDNSIRFEFSNARRAISLVTGPVEEAVADPKQAQALAYLVIVTQSLQTLVGEQLSAALGLSVGFSSLDGD